MADIDLELLRRRIADLEQKDKNQQISQAIAMGGNSPMDDAPSRSEIDAKIEAAEARTDTKFAQTLGEIRATNTRLDHISDLLIESRSGRRVTNGLVIGTGIGATAMIIGALALGAAWFGNGLSAHDIAASAAHQALSQYITNEKNMYPPVVPNVK